MKAKIDLLANKDKLYIVEEIRGNCLILVSLYDATKKKVAYIEGLEIGDVVEL